MAGIPKIKITFDADFDELKKGVKGAQNEVEGFGSKMGGFAQKAGKAFAIAGAAAAAYAGVLLVDGVKSAIEDEAAQAKLATTLENVTGATENQIKAVEDYITQTALANGITDDVLRPSLDRLIRSTKDVTKAQELQTLALDIAAGTGKDLKTVSEALGKAYDGNLGALKKLGVGIDDSIIKSKNFDAAAAALAKTFEGQASQQAETFQGKMARLTVAFDEAKETVGSYVLDAITPLLSTFVDKGIPAISGFADSLGKTLGPAFGEIFTVIRDDVLPILKSWWDFLYKEIIPQILKIVGPILEGLKSAFDKIKKAVEDNSTELQPFYDLLAKIWDFTKKYLVPLLGGAFKTALEGLGTLVAGLVTAFGKFVDLLTGIYNGAKRVIDLIKNNPVTNLFDGGSKGLKAGGAFGAGEDFANPFGGGGGGGAYPLPTPMGIAKSYYGISTADANEFSRKLRILGDAGLIQYGVGVPNFTPGEDPLPNLWNEYLASLVRKPVPETPTPTINVTVNGAIDPEGTARTLIRVLNESQARGTLGAGSFVTV